MFSQSFVLAAAAFTGLVSAQTSSNQSIPDTCSSYTTSGPNLTFSPDCIPAYYRQTWCNAEQNVCETVCGSSNISPDNNVCYASSLTYRCVCDSGFTPNVSMYQQSLPAYLCRQWRDFCTAAHPNDLQGIDACQAVQCGNETATQDPSAESSGSASSTGSATSGSSGSSPSETASTTTSSGSGSGSGSTGTPSGSSSGSSASSTGNAAAALRLGSEYGVAIVGTGLLALFGLAL